METKELNTDRAKWILTSAIVFGVISLYWPWWYSDPCEQPGAFDVQSGDKIVRIPDRAKVYFSFAKSDRFSIVFGSTNCPNGGGHKILTRILFDRNSLKNLEKNNAQFPKALDQMIFLIPGTPYYDRKSKWLDNTTPNEAGFHLERGRCRGYGYSDSLSCPITIRSSSTNLIYTLYIPITKKPGSTWPERIYKDSDLIELRRKTDAYLSSLLQ